MDEPAMDVAIPGALLGAIKDRMHSHRLSTSEDPGHLEAVLGAGDDAISVVDDGPDHCMIGRLVGRSSDGCVYCLVARISLFGYEQLRDGDTAPEDVLSDSRDISLCGVFEEDGVVGNVLLVHHYRHAEKVPAGYLPPGPFLEFDAVHGTDEES